MRRTTMQIDNEPVGENKVINIVIEVDDGMVTDIYADNPLVSVRVIDRDVQEDRQDRSEAVIYKSTNDLDVMFNNYLAYDDEDW
jgi:hypothetical protein